MIQPSTIDQDLKKGILFILYPVSGIKHRFASPARTGPTITLRGSDVDIRLTRSTFRLNCPAKRPKEDDLPLRDLPGIRLTRPPVPGIGRQGEADAPERAGHERGAVLTAPRLTELLKRVNRIFTFRVMQIGGNACDHALTG